MSWMGGLSIEPARSSLIQVAGISYGGIAREQMCCTVAASLYKIANDTDLREPLELFVWIRHIQEHLQSHLPDPSMHAFQHLHIPLTLSNLRCRMPRKATQQDQSHIQRTQGAPLKRQT